MSVFDERLWEAMEHKARVEDEKLPDDRRIANTYIEGVRTVCVYGIDRSKTIRDTFPLYTLHDECHIINVIRIMENLLGSHIDALTRDETAMLILAACCHDIGMSYSEREREEALGNQERISKYLDTNQSEYVMAYSSGEDSPMLTDSMKLNYFRSIHHERIAELLYKIEWPDVLNGNLNCRALISVCQSHGCDLDSLNPLNPTATIDLRFCAVLLRLADILDFDKTRAPQAIYEYSDFITKNDVASKFSESEWDKHLSSGGFDFRNIPDRSFPYELGYNATCKSMQIEQSIHEYLDWVDLELSGCRQEISRYAGEHCELVLPRKINRQIESVGYMSGEYRLTLDQEKVMELLVGKNIYHDPAVFVRELLQNAIDAVRTREKLDSNLPLNWEPRINISSWMDSEGYHWFRIEDNGIGMTEEILRNFFLKIGRSYYNSDQFLKMKLRCKAVPEYTPISRFGIGILSCFMGDEQTNQVEISTKHFEGVSPALRMQMNGLSGYYYLANQKDYHKPGEMRGRNADEKQAYLSQAGTAIAVRTNLYQIGNYRGFKEIVDRYVIFPQVPVHYEGDEGSFDYITEQDFIKAVHEIRPSANIEEYGTLEYPLSVEQIEEIKKDLPSVVFERIPVLVLKCVPLNVYTKSPYLSGAILLAKTDGAASEFKLKVAGKELKADIRIGLNVDREKKSIAIVISLVFPESFEEEMRLARVKNYEIEERMENVIRIMWEKYADKGDYLSWDIVQAIRYGYIEETEWNEHIKDRYEYISISELNAKIKRIEKEYNNILSVSSYERDILNCYKAYEQMKTSWKFKMCCLEDVEWYKAYFLSVGEAKGIQNITAHNGIYCGDANIFIEGDSYHNIGSILLLKDKYRPDVDISRDQIRRLSFEMACDLEIIYKQLEAQGFRFGCIWKKLDDEKCLYIPCRN